MARRSVTGEVAADCHDDGGRAGPRAPARDRAGAGVNRLHRRRAELQGVSDGQGGGVLAGQVVGMTGVLVRTGKFRQDTLDRWTADEFAMQPNHVIDSIADFPELLGL